MESLGPHGDPAPHGIPQNPSSLEFKDRPSAVHPSLRRQSAMKRRCPELPDEEPCTKYMLCVDGVPVRAEERSLFNEEFEPVTADFVQVIGDRGRDLRFLHKPLQYSFLGAIATGNEGIFQELKIGAGPRIGCKQRKKLHRPSLSSLASTVRVRGRDVRVWAPRRDALYLEVTEENVAWFMEQVRADAKSGALTADLEDPAEDPEANIFGHEPLEDDDARPEDDDPEADPLEADGARPEDDSESEFAAVIRQSLETIRDVCPSDVSACWQASRVSFCLTQGQGALRSRR